MDPPDQDLLSDFEDSDSLLPDSQRDLTQKGPQETWAAIRRNAGWFFGLLFCSSLVVIVIASLLYGHFMLRDFDDIHNITQNLPHYQSLELNVLFLGLDGIMALLCILQIVTLFKWAGEEAIEFPEEEPPDEAKATIFQRRGSSFVVYSFVHSIVLLSCLIIGGLIESDFWVAVPLLAIAVINFLNSIVLSTMKFVLKDMKENRGPRTTLKSRKYLLFLLAWGISSFSGAAFCLAVEIHYMLRNSNPNTAPPYTEEQKKLFFGLSWGIISCIILEVGALVISVIITGLHMCEKLRLDRVKSIQQVVSVFLFIVQCFHVGILSSVFGFDLRLVPSPNDYLVDFPLLAVAICNGLSSLSLYFFWELVLHFAQEAGVAEHFHMQ